MLARSRAWARMDSCRATLLRASSTSLIRRSRSMWAMMPSRERDVAVSKILALTESRVAWAARTRLRVAKPSQMGCTSLAETLPTLNHWSSRFRPRDVVSLRTPTPISPVTSTRGPKPARALLSSCSRTARFSLMLIRLRWLCSTPYTVSFTEICVAPFPCAGVSRVHAVPVPPASRQHAATIIAPHVLRVAIIFYPLSQFFEMHSYYAGILYLVNISIFFANL